MRFCLMLLLSVFVTPAHAEVAGQFASTRAVFAPGDPSLITDGLDGNWLELLGYAQPLQPDADASVFETYAEEFLEQNCASPSALQIEVDKAGRFTTWRSSHAGTVIQYDWVVANSTLRLAPTFMRRALVAPGDSADYEPSPSDGPVQFYRPSADIFVMTERNGTNSIYGRCSAGD